MDIFYKHWQQLQHRYFLPHMDLTQTQDPFKYLWCKEKVYKAFSSDVNLPSSCNCSLFGVNNEHDFKFTKEWKKIARDSDDLEIAQDWCSQITALSKTYLISEHKKTNFRHVLANYIFHAKEHDVFENETEI